MLTLTERKRYPAGNSPIGFAIFRSCSLFLAQDGHRSIVVTTSAAIFRQKRFFFRGEYNVYISFWAG